MGDPSTPRSARRRLWLSYACGAFGLAMAAQISFLVPLRARELGAGFDAIGLIVGAGALAAALTSIPSGAVIDRLGPKRSFIVGALGTSVVSLGFVFATNYWWFIALQPLHGILRNLGWVASQAYIASLASDDDRALMTGRFSFFSNVGQMAGPLLVGVAASASGFRWAMLVPAAYAFVFAVAGTSLPETRSADHLSGRSKQGLGIGAARALLSIPGVQVALVLTSTRLWTSNVYQTFLPVFLVEQDIDPALVGVIMATSGFVAAATAPSAGFWARLLAPQLATMAGLTCSVIGLVIAPLSTTVPWVFATPILVGIGTGLSLPLLITIVTTAAPPTQRGLALGLRGMVNQTAATAAPVIVGPLMTALGLTLGFIAGGGAGLGLLAVAGVIHHRRMRAQTPDAGGASHDRSRMDAPVSWPGKKPPR